MKRTLVGGAGDNAARLPPTCLAQPALDETIGQLSGTGSLFPYTLESDEELIQQLHMERDFLGNQASLPFLSSPISTFHSAYASFKRDSFIPLI